MSNRNVQIVERMWSAWHATVMSGWFEFFDDDVVWHTREDEPDAGVYRGHAGIEELMEFWADNFDELRVDAEEFIGAGSCVAVPSTVRGRGTASGAEVELAYTFVWRLSGGKIVEVREYSTKSEALEALGAAGEPRRL
jgi:ketosteroid isomerase-like protein